MSKNNCKKDGILFLCQYFYPEKVSSATLPTDTAKFLSSKGYKVGCLCGYPKEYLQQSDKVENREKVFGIDIERVKYTTFKKRNFIGRLVNYFSFTFKCFFRIKRAKNYEYIVVYSNPPILPFVAYKAHKKYGTKIIFVSYDVYPEIAINTGALSDNGIITRLMKKINNKLYSAVEKVVVLSPDMKEFILHNRNVAADKVAVIPNWFADIPFNAPKKRQPFTVTYLGNMGICQDMETLLLAVKALNGDASFRFVIGGQGNKAERVKDFIRENNLTNVEFHPFIVGEEYERIMKESHCFIVSTERNINGLCFPSKYYSYLAFGRPVIAIMEENSLTKELAENKIGYAVTNGDNKALVERIKEIAAFKEKQYSETCDNVYKVFKNNYTTELCNKKFVDKVIRSDK